MDRFAEIVRTPGAGEGSGHDEGQSPSHQQIEVANQILTKLNLVGTPRGGKARSNAVAFIAGLAGDTVSTLEKMSGYFHKMPLNFRHLEETFRFLEGRKFTGWDNFFRDGVLGPTVTIVERYGVKFDPREKRQGIGVISFVKRTILPGVKPKELLTEIAAASTEIMEGTTFRASDIIPGHIPKARTWKRAVREWVRISVEEYEAYQKGRWLDDD